jgi:hypothetical protein
MSHIQYIRTAPTLLCTHEHRERAVGIWQKWMNVTVQHAIKSSVYKCCIYNVYSARRVRSVVISTQWIVLCYVNYVSAKLALKFHQWSGLECNVNNVLHQKAIQIYTKVSQCSLTQE